MIFEHYLRKPYVYPIDETTLRIRLKLKKGYAEKVNIIFKSIYNHDVNFYSKVEMKLLFEYNDYLYLEADASHDLRYFKYNFEVFRNGEVEYFNIDGVSKENNQKRYYFLPFINDYEIIKLPKRFEGGVCYQVLIDRFYHEGERTNFNELSNWDELPDRSTYYGGNYRGLKAKIPYLKSLNTEILYLSPVFKSPTYHKYDTIDYYKLDEIYGTEEDLKDLIHESHKAGIKVLFDGVFNHISNQSEIFKDVVKNEENSKYKDWFYLEGFPIDESKPNYDTFGNKLVPEMPKFDTNNDEVIKYLTDAALYWTEKLNLDGWRLDVYDEVSIKFWRVFREVLKEYNPDLIIVGEIWEQSQRWMDGSQIDTFTNYRFKDLVFDLLERKIDVSGFWNLYKKHYLEYPSVYYNYFVNLLGSHDTTRISSLANVVEQELILVLTVMFPGIPLIYYGDELALEGGDDPDNRRAMRWDYLEDETRKKLYKQIKKATDLRSDCKAIKYGNLVIEDYGKDVLAFTREYEEKQVTCLFNFGTMAYKLKAEAKHLLGTVQETIQQHEYVIFERRK